MNWQLPSLNALRAFEAAARHLSFTKAATELYLTQSAVSQQIRAMEDYLGVLLFERIKQRLVLTKAGNIYANEIRSALEHMQTATVNLRASCNMDNAHILKLSTPPAFCTKWLISRLNNFSNIHSEISISLVTRIDPFDFEAQEIDAAIYFGRGDWPGVESDHLTGENLIPVCSPTYLASRPPLKQPIDLASHTLLQHMHRPNWWNDWLTAKQTKITNAWSGPQFEHFYMIMQAAAAGLGVALLPRLLVEEDLYTQRLVMPFDSPFEGQDAYWLVYPAHRRSHPQLKLLRRWLFKEIADEKTS